MVEEYGGPVIQFASLGTIARRPGADSKHSGFGREYRPIWDRGVSSNPGTILVAIVIRWPSYE